MTSIINKTTRNIIVIILITLILASCSQEKEKEAFKTTPNKEFILKHSLYNETIQLTGTVKAKKTSQVSAKTGGKIKNLYADIGDFVLQDTLLGDLSGDESKVNILAAQRDQTDLQSVYNAKKKLFDEQVYNAEKNLEQANANLYSVSTRKDLSGINTSEQVKLIEKQVKENEVKLENIIISNESKLNNIYQQASTSFRLAMIAISNAVNFSDTILGVSNTKKQLNNHYEDNIGALSKNNKNKSIASLKNMLNLKKELKQLYDQKIEGENLSHLEIDDYLPVFLINLEQCQIMLNDLYSTLQNSTTGNNLSKTQLEEFKIEVTQISKNIENNILNNNNLGIHGLIKKIELININNNNNLEEARSVLASVQQKLKQQKAQQNKEDIDSENLTNITEISVKQAQSALEIAKSQRESSLKELERQLSLVKSNKQLSQVAVSNTHLGSPFTGVITKKYAEIGQVITPGQSVFEIADNSSFKILTDISDLDLSKITNNLNAKVTIDGINGEYNAQISKIYPQVDPQTHKINIELIINDHLPNLKIGMFARINIILPESTAYFLPEEFIHYDYQGAYIFTNKKQYIHRAEKKDNLIKIWFDGEMENVKVKDTLSQGIGLPSVTTSVSSYSLAEHP